MNKYILKSTDLYFQIVLLEIFLLAKNDIYEWMLGKYQYFNK